MDTLIETMKTVSEAIDEVEVNPAKDEQEQKFRNKVDSIYKVTTITSTVIFGVGGVFFVPLIAVGAGVALALSQLHWYDKQHDYKLSHWISNTWSSFAAKFKHKKAEKPLITELAPEEFLREIKRVKLTPIKNEISNNPVKSANSAEVIQLSPANAQENAKLTTNRNAFFKPAARRSVNDDQFKLVAISPRAAG